MKMLPEVDLARTPSFSVGLLEVNPQLREIRRGIERQRIEPRVMQAIVALFDMHESIVSRDELIRRCWGGRAISEDALNRVISKVRHVLSEIGCGEFEVETVTKVGYRLTPAGSIETVTPRAPLAKVPFAVLPRGKWHWGAILLAVVLLLGTGWALWRSTQSHSTIGESSAAVQTPPPAPLVEAASDLETRGLSAMFEGDPARAAQGIDYLRQATAIAPRRAGVWGSLAMAYVISLAYTPQSQQLTIVSRVRETASHALSIDAREGRSIAALVSLEPTYGSWTLKDRQLQEALAKAPPNTAPLMFQRVQFLASVGRTSEALALVERLSSISPYLPWIQSARANLLSANGRPDEAERVALRASEIWPRERLTWFTRFYLAAYGGKPQDALAMAADRSNWPEKADRQEVELAIKTAEALSSGSSVEAEDLLATLRPLAAHDQRYTEQAIRTAVALRRMSDAMRFAQQLYGAPANRWPRGVLLPRIGYDAVTERTTAPLFLLPASDLWRDNEYMPLMKKIGLLDYWQNSAAPDFCQQPAFTLKCRQWGLKQ